MMRIKEFFLGIWAFFMVLGWVPIALVGIVFLLLGYEMLAEYIVVLGIFGWVAIQMLVVALAVRSDEKSWRDGRAG
jgi:hypothetical protein